jgi:hypothetical protein
LFFRQGLRHGALLASCCFFLLLLDLLLLRFGCWPGLLFRGSIGAGVSFSINSQLVVNQRGKFWRREALVSLAKKEM